MFVSKRTHNQLIKTLTEQYEARISQLQDTVQDLRRLVFSPTSASSVPLVHLEADAVMSQKEEVMEVDPEEAEKMSFLLREQDRIFSGAYEEMAE